MKPLSIKCLLLTVALTISTISARPADNSNKSNGKNRSEAVDQDTKAARVLQDIIAAPDKAIPDELLESASCVAVFPSVIKGGFVFGAQYGRGVVSCRTSSGRWSEPLFVSVGGGSFGLQIGAEAIDLVLLGMNPSTADIFTKDRFELGGEASVAAGPVGRTGSAATDLPTIKSQFLSYARSRGLFAGLELQGSVIKQDKDLNRAVYGANYVSANILRTGAAQAPDQVHVFIDALNNYTPAKNAAVRK